MLEQQTRSSNYPTQPTSPRSRYPVGEERTTQLLQTLQKNDRNSTRRHQTIDPLEGNQTDLCRLRRTQDKDQNRTVESGRPQPGPHFFVNTRFHGPFIYRSGTRLEGIPFHTCELLRAVPSALHCGPFSFRHANPDTRRCLGGYSISCP